MQHKHSVLIVEDQPELATILRDYLEREGFSCTLLDTGTAVVDLVRADPPDIMLLDIKLPGLDGFAICSQIRRFSDLPIIVVTARVEEIDRLLGLELGADDYICKPFSPREVVARVKAVLRRWQNRGKAVTQGLIELYPERFEARCKGQLLDLTPIEFKILQMLMKHPEQAFSRELIIARIYDDHRVVTHRTVDTHIKNLRKKLRQRCPDLDLIQSVYGLGYKMGPTE